MTVLILGSLDDEHVVRVRQHLQQRGTDVELLDSRWFPTQLRLAWDPASGNGSLSLPTRRRLDLRQFTAVYWRSYFGVGSPDLPHPEQSYVAFNDARSLFESLLIRLPVRWVNGWRAFQLHQSKPLQLAMVADLGVAIPDTLLTNDPEQVREFVSRHPRSIFKPVQGGAHTRRIEPKHLSDEHLQNLSIAPITLQEEIAGTDVRVFVAGERVMACEILTEAIDFRDDPEPTIRPITLPEELQSQARRIAQTLDLLWTGMDFRRTPDSRFVFLEANPSPMFLGFEERTGLPLLESLCDLLVEGPRASGAA